MSDNCTAQKLIFLVSPSHHAVDLEQAWMLSKREKQSLVDHAHLHQLWGH